MIVDHGSAGGAPTPEPNGAGTGGDSRRHRRRRRQRAAELRRHCQDRLAGLGLPVSADLHEIAAHLGRRRGRPIQLVAFDAPPAAPCGVWISTADRDLIGYARNTSAYHQDHIIAHELAHLICGHAGIVDAQGSAAELLFPDLHPGLLRRLLHRASCTDGQEEEAEIMAGILVATVRGRPGSSTSDSLDGIEAALGFRRSADRPYG